MHPETLVVEITGNQDKIDGLLAMLQPFGVLEMVQTGMVAMTRGAKGSAAASSDPAPIKGVVAA